MVKPKEINLSKGRSQARFEKGISTVGRLIEWLLRLSSTGLVLMIYLADFRSLDELVPCMPRKVSKDQVLNLINGNG
jgi:hypothetical protein